MARSEERLAARRQTLVEVAQALIRERGDAGFSMTLLAERAVVSAATPYNLLGSKAEILRHVVRDDIARFVRELEGHAGDTPLRSLPIAADRLVSHYERDGAFNRGLFRAAFSTDAPELRGALSAESRAWWKTLVQATTDSGELVGVVRASQLTDALLRMMGGVAQTWLTAAWPANRFALEMSLSVRLVLASVSTPPLGDDVRREMADLQAAIASIAHGPASTTRSAGRAPAVGQDWKLSAERNAVTSSAGVRKRSTRDRPSGPATATTLLIVPP